VFSVIKHHEGLTEGDSRIYEEKNKKTNAYEKLKANDFIQTRQANIKLQNPKGFSWI